MAFSKQYGNADFVPVILGTGMGAYTVARCLHQAYGVRSLALGRAVLAECANSAIVDALAVPGFDRAETVLATLARVAAKLPSRKLLLVPTIEMYSAIVAEHYAEIRRSYIVASAQQRTHRLLGEKDSFYAACSEAGLAYPRTLVVGANEDATAAALEAAGIGFPLILKPANTDIYPRLHFAGRQKVYLIDTAEQLRETVAMVRAGGYGEPLICQQYLAGDEAVMRSVNTYSNTDGHLQALCFGQIAVTDRHPERVGNNNAIVALHDPDLTPAVRSFLDGIGYSGFANFDFLYDAKAGCYKVLEVNLRLGASSFYTMAGGVNPLRHCVEDLIYGRRLPWQRADAQPRLWTTIPRALVARYRPDSLGQLVAEAGRAGCFHTLFYSRDARPARLAMCARVEARLARDTVKYARSRLNS